MNDFLDATDTAGISWQRRLLLQMPSNDFHPLVYVGGAPVIGRDVYIGLFSEINAVGANVVIGDGCDIASFVSINVADSHLKCIGRSGSIDRRDITLGDRVFVGTHSAVLGGCHLGSGSVVAAGSVVRDLVAPPYSLIYGNPAICIPGKYDPDTRSSRDGTGRTS